MNLAPAPTAMRPQSVPPAGPADRRATLALADPAATRALAGRLADGLAALGGPLTICLWGTLGAGKTTLVRALIDAATGEAQEVPSPTFTLVQTYPLPFATLWHFDLYRLADPAEVYELGWEEADLACVEWPDRLGDLLPAERLDLALAFASDGQADDEERRLAHLIGRGDTAARLIDAARS